MADLSLTAPASVASSSQVYSHFDVFINHRGPDVKKGLASHLHTSLRGHGLRVFLDDREMEQGHPITPQIQWAIQTASVHLAIFSPRYAQSRWCLDELLMMLDSGSTIIPIFYGVNPSVLRWTQGGDGVYARDLRNLESKTTTDSQTNKKKTRYDSNTIKKWRKALFDVSHISGFELQAFNGDEGPLLEEVVRLVLNKVTKPSLYVAQYPIGLEGKVKEFETTVLSQQQSGKTGAVGVVGLGGVGKSTLAKEFFNRHRSSYDRSCFVDDVRENAAKNSINLLQATLLKELAQRDEQINGPNEGEDRDTAIRIWDGSEWEGLLSFRKLENRCLVDVDSENRIRMHDHLRDLGRDLAKEHPGCRLWRPTDNLLYNLSGQSHVRGISMVPWIEQSFENLAGRHLVTNMSSLQLLRAEGYFVERLFSLGNLPQLIYLRWDNCPSSSLPSSFSIKNLRVLYLQGQNLETLWQHESQVPLQLRELHIHAELLKIIPNSIGKLKHLEKFVLHCNNLETLPDSIGNLTSLQSLSLDWCKALQMLPDSVGQLTSLQSLSLKWCFALQMLPDSVGQLTSLQSLSLVGCSALQMLPDSVGQLTSLQSLSLKWCSALQMLPDSVGQLTSLQSLSLEECSDLQMLPDSVGQLTSLQSLSLGGCSALQMLPNSVGQMKSLQSLSLSWCSALQTLPDSVGQMTNLKELYLNECAELKELPAVEHLKSLENLDVSNCPKLQLGVGVVEQLHQRLKKVWA